MTSVYSTFLLLLICNVTFDPTVGQQSGTSGTFTFPVDSGGGDLSNVCRLQKQCGLCLQVRGCEWCNDPRYLQEANNFYDRCNTQPGHQLGGCTSFERKGDAGALPLKNTKPSALDPSGFDARLWVGQKVNISFTYTDSGNKPLDLYYLMDLSHTMGDDKASVAELGRTFAQALQSNTKNLKMGFGSFVDKPVMPFASQSHITRPEPGLRPVYGFENQLPLNTDTILFQSTVRDAFISVNLDSPEGGLDAMMQVLECGEQIGWRPDAHRILVVSTDGTFHIAGDGKLGGIVIPHDGQCHLDAHGLYTHSTILDYPSVAQLVAKIREKKIYVIFAVQREVEFVYKTLSQLMSEYAFTIRLDAKSSEVGNLVREQYDKIRSTLEFSTKPILKDSELGVTYYVKCGRGESFVKGNKCSDLKSNDAVEVKTELELKRCPAEYSDREWTQELQISPTASESSVTVNLQLKCGCACEEQRQGPGKDQQCSNKGSVECGICHCNDKFGGDRCQCDLSVNHGDGTKCVKECIRDRGTCQCGQCICKKPWTGPTCEYDERNCPCVKESRGRCYREQCSCEAGWTTEYGHPPCTCSKHECIKDGETCSGRGTCQCNRCVCDDGFVGKFCDVCQRCDCLNDLARCAVERAKNKTYVQRVKDGETPSTHIEGLTCPKEISSPWKITLVTQNDSTSVEESGKECIPEYDGCNLKYTFNYDQDSREVQLAIDELLSCQGPVKPVQMLPIILGTVGSILLIGILTLLLWKVITTLIDRHEFNKFQQECQNRKWEIGGNPLYKEATSTFQNPAYTD